MSLGVGVGVLLLQLVALSGHDCLLSDSLLGNLLCCEAVFSECGCLLGCFFALLPSEGAAVMYLVFLPPVGFV